MSYRGDVRLGSTVHLKFSTVNTSAVPTTLTGGTVAAYPDNSTTELTAGVTLTTDFDGRTGLHHVAIVATSGNGYLTATNYDLVVTAGTVGGTSVVGMVVGSFSIEARSAVMSTTVGRTLDISAGGEAGVDWANVGGATTAQALTNTSIASVTGAVGSVTGSVASVTGSVGSVTGAVGSVTGSVASVTGNVGGNVVGSVGSVVGDTKQTGDCYLRLGAPATTSVSGDIAQVYSLTNTVNSTLNGVVTTTTTTLNNTTTLLTNVAAIGTALNSVAAQITALPPQVWTVLLEASFNAQQVMRLLLASAAGRLSGAGTSSVVIRDVGNVFNRISATVDPQGNRTAVTYDVT